jgi:hypothetical protein
MKKPLLFIVILIANVSFSQTKKIVSFCDTTKFNNGSSAPASVRSDFTINGVKNSIQLKVEVLKDKYSFLIIIPTNKPEVTIKNELFIITMEHDSDIIYLTKGNTSSEFSTRSKQYGYFFMFEGKYKDEQWQMLIKKRIKSIKNFTGEDFFIKPEESKNLLADLKCYATKFK